MLDCGARDLSPSRSLRPLTRIIEGGVNGYSDGELFLLLESNRSSGGIIAFHRVE